MSYLGLKCLNILILIFHVGTIKLSKVKLCLMKKFTISSWFDPESQLIF